MSSTDELVRGFRPDRSSFKKSPLRLISGVPFGRIAVLLIFFSFILLQFRCTEEPLAPSPLFTLEVSSTDGGEVFWEPQKDTLLAGTAVYLSAQPQEGYYFAGFEGDLRSIQNPTSIEMNSDLQITAVFQPFPTALVHIDAKDSTFIMGSDDPQALSIERPAHEVRFTYDYALSPTEITQRQYAQIMGESALEKLLGRGDFGRGDSLPVYNVTWYEAALFCNKMSKNDGLDTVYSYTAVCEVPGSCPYVLENLQIHYEEAGYRLPTEAEWEYALKQNAQTAYFWGSDSSQKYAWSSLNSEGGPQRVGQLQPTGNGLFDMAGNVWEWVNDWLGAYPDSLVVNPTGPHHLSLEEFEQSSQRPIRGGGWELGESHLRTTNRRGPYEVPAATASERIGFRIALGPFESRDSEESSSSDELDTISQVTLLSKKSDVLGFLGTTECKLVFTLESLEDNQIITVDYSDYGLEAEPMHVDPSAKGAVISPDGNWLAYGTQYPGYSDGSRIGVVPYGDTTRNSTVVSIENAFLPYWWCDTNGVDTCLIYTTGASQNTDNRWRNEKTVKHQWRSGAFGTYSVIRDSGSYHGGLSADGRFLATGYPKARLWDRRLNYTFPLFVPPYNGLQDSVQVCNVSINPGHRYTDRVMLLDFGSGRSTNHHVGESYGIHEYIFVVQSDLYTNHVVNYYQVPEGFAQWQDTRYTNHPDFGIGVAASGNVSTVFLINLETKEYLPLVSGENIRWPSLWIDPQGLSEEEDPHHAFMQYNIPNTAAGGQMLITGKLKLFWKRRDTYEAAVVGSSPEAYGIHTSLFSLPAINMATGNADQLTSNILLNNYILPHAPELKVVVIGLDPGFLSRDTRPEDPWLVGLYDSRGYNYDKNNNFWRDGIPAEIQRKIDILSSEDWPEVDSTGTLQEELTGGWGEPIIDQTGSAFEDSIVQMNIRFLRAAVDSCLQRDVAVLIVNAPQHPEYRDTEVMGRYGPRWEEYQKIDSLMREWENQIPSLRFYDAHNYGEHDYAEDEFVDPNHLNTKGAMRFSERIDSVLLNMGL